MRTRGSRTYHRIDRVHYGAGTFEMVPDEAKRLGAGRAIAIVSATLRRTTPLVDRLAAMLGPALVDIVEGVPAHTPRDAVIRVAERARAAKADLVITLGGGSVMDCGQLARLVLEHGLTSPDELDRFRTVVHRDGSREVPSFKGPTIPQIAIATTLSASEFNPILGATDTARKVKDIFVHPDIAPQIIILDPEVCLHTPERLWLSSGIRGIDHAVETICAPLVDEYSMGPALHALKLLTRALPASRREPSSTAHRLDCLIGTWLSADHTMAAIPKGASHGIGHMLGSVLGMGHGETSCIMLPAVLTYNLDYTREAQVLVAKTMGQPGQPAAQVVRDFVRSLGLPTGFREVGVGEEAFPAIAAAAMQSHYLFNNPRPIRSEADVIEVLRLAL